MLLILLFTVTVLSDYTVKINSSTSFGPWEGWGCSLCWYANVFGDRDDIADVIFTTKTTTINGEDLPGLGLNIARYNAGGSSWNTYNDSSMVASPNIPDWKQIPGYWLDWGSEDPTSSSWNWTEDDKQRQAMTKAKERGANFIELFSNSPMWWMCDNHNPSGSNNGADDNLQTWNQDQHAIYLANIAKYAQDNWGISFDSVEAFNEPTSNWWTSTGTQEGCHFDASTQIPVIQHLRTELNNRGLNNMRVAASDETSYTAALNTWNSFNSSTQSLIGQVNVHGYEYGGGRRDLLYAAVNGKRLWNSEYGDGDGSGISLASNLNLDFYWLHPTAWCYWQPLDGGGWGLIQSTPGNQWIGNTNPKYFVVAQYTRHIRPGMTILQSLDENTVAAYNSANKTLVLITTNYNTAQTITYDLTNYKTLGAVTRWVTDTSGSVQYKQYNDVTITSGKFAVKFDTNSIQTFQIENVS